MRIKLLFLLIFWILLDYLSNGQTTTTAIDPIEPEAREKTILSPGFCPVLTTTSTTQSTTTATSTSTQIQSTTTTEPPETSTTPTAIDPLQPKALEKRILSPGFCPVLTTTSTTQSTTTATSTSTQTQSTTTTELPETSTNVAETSIAPLTTTTTTETPTSTANVLSATTTELEESTAIPTTTVESKDSTTSEPNEKISTTTEISSTEKSTSFPAGKTTVNEISTQKVTTAINTIPAEISTPESSQASTEGPIKATSEEATTNQGKKSTTRDTKLSTTNDELTATSEKVVSTKTSKATSPLSPSTTTKSASSTPTVSSILKSSTPKANTVSTLSASSKTTPTSKSSSTLPTHTSSKTTTTLTTPIKPDTTIVSSSKQTLPSTTATKSTKPDSTTVASTTKSSTTLPSKTSTSDSITTPSLSLGIEKTSTKKLTTMATEDTTSDSFFSIEVTSSSTTKTDITSPQGTTEKDASADLTLSTVTESGTTEQISSSPETATTDTSKTTTKVTTYGHVSTSETTLEESLSMSSTSGATVVESSLPTSTVASDSNSISTSAVQKSATTATTESDVSSTSASFDEATSESRSTAQQQMTTIIEETTNMNDVTLTTTVTSKYTSDVRPAATKPFVETTSTQAKATTLENDHVLTTPSAPSSGTVTTLSISESTNQQQPTSIKDSESHITSTTTALSNGNAQNTAVNEDDKTSTTLQPITSTSSLTDTSKIATTTTPDESSSTKAIPSQSSSAAPSSTTTTMLTTTTEPPPIKPLLFCGAQPCAFEADYDAKISFGYHDRTGLNCSSKNCGTLKSLKFKRIFLNGTEENEFTNVDNSTLNGNIWSIPVMDVLKASFGRSSIDSFIVQAETENSNEMVSSWTYTVKNNQAPSPGTYSVSPTSFPAMTNVTFSCSSWTDPDGIISYSFCKSGPTTQNEKVLIGTSSNPTAFYTLSEGQYNIYVSATDSLAATSDIHFLQQVTVSAANIYQYLNDNETKTLSEIDAILDSFSNGSLIKDIIGNDYVLDPTLPKSVQNFLQWVLDHPNADYLSNGQTTTAAIDPIEPEAREKTILSPSFCPVLTTTSTTQSTTTATSTSTQIQSTTTTEPPETSTTPTAIDPLQPKALEKRILSTPFCPVLTTTSTTQSTTTATSTSTQTQSTTTTELPETSTNVAKTSMAPLTTTTTTETPTSTANVLSATTTELEESPEIPTTTVESKDSTTSEPNEKISTTTEISSTEKSTSFPAGKTTVNEISTQKVTTAINTIPAEISTPESSQASTEGPIKATSEEATTNQGKKSTTRDTKLSTTNDELTATSEKVVSTKTSKATSPLSPSTTTKSASSTPTVSSILKSSTPKANTVSITTLSASSKTTPTSKSSSTLPTHTSSKTTTTPTTPIKPDTTIVSSSKQTLPSTTATKSTKPDSTTVASTTKSSTTLPSKTSTSDSITTPSLSLGTEKTSTKKLTTMATEDTTSDSFFSIEVTSSSTTKTDITSPQGTTEKDASADLTLSTVAESGTTEQISSSPETATTDTSKTTTKVTTDGYVSTSETTLEESLSLSSTSGATVAESSLPTSTVASDSNSISTSAVQKSATTATMEYDVSSTSPSFDEATSESRSTEQQQMTTIIDETTNMNDVTLTTTVTSKYTSDVRPAATKPFVETTSTQAKATTLENDHVLTTPSAPSSGTVTTLSISESTNQPTSIKDSESHITSTTTALNNGNAQNTAVNEDDKTSTTLQPITSTSSLTDTSKIVTTTTPDESSSTKSIPSQSSSAVPSSTTTTMLTTTTEPPPIKPLLFCGAQPCAFEADYDAKISFGYHDRIGLNCTSKNCGTLKSLKFKRIFLNGTEENEFTNVDNSTLNGNIWSIPVMDVLKASFRRSSIDSFIVKAETENSNEMVSSWTYTVKNNQAPLPGSYSVSPTSFPAMTNATFSCSGWTDPDGIISYSFYKSGPTTQNEKVLIGTSSNPTAFYTLSEGQYNIYASASDTLAATSDMHFLQQITVSAANVYQYLNDNETKSLSEIDAILDSFTNGTLIKDIIGNDYVLDPSLPKSVQNFLQWVLDHPNATPDEINNALKTTLDNQLTEYTNGLSREQILDLINKNLKKINDKKAEVLGEVLSGISQTTPITSSSDLVKVLQSTSSALKQSISFTVNGDVLNTGNILYARIHNSASDLILLNGYINAKNNTVYLEGDFRVAKYLQKNGLDNFDATFTYNTASVNAYIYENDSSITIEPGKFQLFPLSTQTGISFFGETTVFIGSEYYQHHLITAWNVSYDTTIEKYGKEQEVKNATFTTFLSLSEDERSFLTFPILTNSSIKDFTTGKPLTIGESKLSFNILTKDSKPRIATMEIKSGQLLFKKSNETISLWIVKFEWTNADALLASTGYDWKSFIPEKLKLENISRNFMEQLIPGTNMQIFIEGVGDLPATLATGFEDEKELAITIDIRWLLYSSVTIGGKWNSINDFMDTFRQGTPVNVTSGRFDFEDGKNLFFNNGFIQYAGSTLFYQLVPNTEIQQLDNVAWDVLLNNGIITFNIERAFVNKNSTDHFQTIITLTNGGEIQIAGGVLYRNSTNGYIISYGDISATGIDLTETGLKKQNLFNLQTQQAFSEIMENVTDTLKKIGANMSADDLSSAAKYILQISDDLSKGLESAFSNPLDSTLQKSLAYELTNYNDIFNWLPLNPADIRYVEDFDSEEEWAEQAAYLQQKLYAAKMIYSMNAMLSALEDAEVAKFLASGKTVGSINYSVGGTTMQIDIGKMADLLSQLHACNDWTVQLPPKISDLNTPVLNASELYRLSLICQDTNVYMYTENAYYLVTSGYVNSTLKTATGGSKIEISNTLAPITVTGKNYGDDRSPTRINYDDFDDYEILDIHSWVTEQWNGTMFVEIRVIDDNAGSDVMNDVKFFMNFQLLPGPLPRDHEISATTYIFKDQQYMYNRTGRYYIGMGFRNCEEDEYNSTTVSYDNVTTQYVANGTCYKRELPFKYSLKAYTKAGYYYDEKLKKFVNYGIVTQPLIGNNLTQFHTNHMTVFSVGMFTPEIPSQFVYDYQITELNKNPTISLMILFTFLCTLLMVYGATISEQDFTFGYIVNNSDNLPNNNYQYIIMVDTGYKIFAGTRSNIFISLFGTEGETTGRLLKGKFSMKKRINHGTKACTRERFLVTTDKPLGDLHYIQLWTDLKGMEDGQAWQCDQIDIKDMQTGKRYLFEVGNWFDRKETWTIAVKPSRHPIIEASRIQNLVENFMFMIPISGGYGRFRHCYNRIFFALEYGKNVITMIGFACFIVRLYFNNNQYDPLAAPEETYLIQFFCYQIQWKDILYGCACGLFLTCYAFPSFVLQRFLPMNQHLEDYEWLNAFQKALYYWGNYLLWYIIEFIYYTIDFYFMYVFWKAGLKLSSSGIDGQVNMASKLIYIGLIFHIIFEFIKSYIINVILLCFSRDYYIISGYEKYCLKTLPMEAFQDVRNPFPVKPKLMHIKTDMKKMAKRERLESDNEKLLNFSRRIFVITFHLIIVFAMVFITRDNDLTIVYRKALMQLYNCNPDSPNPRSTMSFPEIKGTSDFWAWAQEDLVDGILVAPYSWKANDPVFGLRGFWNDRNSRSIGIGVIRQIRSSNWKRNCTKNDEGWPEKKVCINFFPPEERTAAYSNGWKFVVNKTDANDSYIYKTAEETDALPYSGRFNTYSPGGYQFLLMGNKKDLRAKLQQLQAEKWIDGGTRAIIIDLAAYNAPLNYFGVVKLVLEISPHTGELMPSVTVDALRLFKYVDKIEWIVKTIEGAWLFLAFFYVTKEVLFCIWYKFGHLKSFWAWLDVFVAICVVWSNQAFYARLAKITEMSDIFSNTNGNVFINFDKVVHLEWMFRFTMSYSTIAAGCKSFDIFRFIPDIQYIMISVKRVRFQIYAWFGLFVPFFIFVTSSIFLYGYKRGDENLQNYITFCLNTIHGFFGPITNLDQDKLGPWVPSLYYIFIIWSVWVPINFLINIYTGEYLAIRFYGEYLESEIYQIYQHIKLKVKIFFGCVDGTLDEKPFEFEDVSNKVEGVDEMRKRLDEIEAILKRVELNRYRGIPIPAIRNVIQ